MKTLELLAPAKDLATARAAIDSGADAVYMGGPRLGARAAATNSMEDIRQAARYAHLYGARLYMTMNTIVYEHELEEARKIAQEAIEAGVDALIVQDMAYCRMGLEGAELHASTQMYNASPERVRFLGQAGFSRIVLERGLTADQMREICSATDKEIEVFIHGAICVCGSGRCYMSRSLSHRSGNRGECSQPCRQRYDLRDGSGKIIRKGLHLLSVKDLDLSAHIGELIDMGVVSFKIEGRLKDEAYVRNITAHYSRLLDEAIAARKCCRRASRGRVSLDFSPSPAKTFTRSGGDYIFRGKRAGLASFDTPKAMGERLGRVTKIVGRSFLLDKKSDLASGDGICFIAAGELVGTNINSAEAGGRITPNRMEGIAVGTDIYRNYHKAFYDTLGATRTRRSMPVWATLSTDKKGCTLSLRNEEGTIVEATTDTHFEPATKGEMAIGSITSSLRKSGSSPFDVVDVEFQFDGPVPFIPTGALNALRREALERLEELLRNSQPPKNIAPEDPTVPYSLRTIGGDHNVANSLARRFYTDHGVERIDEGYDLLPDLEGVEVMRTPYCIRREIGQCLKQGSRLKEPLTLIHGTEEYRLRFDCKECSMHIEKM
ncbi:MAG: U32 family peptidase [Tidjanibacter sp.]|nr:U32 family peptidase [Tidjanibacter sp.]